MANFWSNNVATKSEMGSLGLVVDDDDDVGCGSDSGGVCGCSLVTVNGVIFDEDIGDDDEAATGGGCEGAVDIWLVLLRFRGWY